MNAFNVLWLALLFARHGNRARTPQNASVSSGDDAHARALGVEVLH